MAQNITLLGANYPDVPAVQLPITGGGTATFSDTRSVTYNLTGGASASVTPSEVVAGQGFSLKLKAPAGYNLNNVTVTMGGVDITSTAFTPDESGGGGGGGTVTITDEANATGTTCVITTSGSPTPPTPVETWETLFNGTPSANADSPYNYFWIADLADVNPVANEVYRIAIDSVEYRCTATSANTSSGVMVCVGNPKYSGGTDDGSNAPFNFYNAGWGAWVGDTELAAGSHSVKVERLVTS